MTSSRSAIWQTRPLRVPFVRRCELSFPDGTRASAFLVNISIVGAYVAHDVQPEVGERLLLRFLPPDSEVPIEVAGLVAWQNPHQSDPVRSLPPGFGMKLEPLSERAAREIARVVEEYAARLGRDPHG